MIDNRFNIFHTIIITSILSVLLLGVSGCGYKKPPYYPKEKAGAGR
ncbi:hypothetical protein NNO_0427 [Hydrogenimonas sp.]|nr:hypothetical protein NNO_0427 [Hydrogenimonas sp.]